MLCDEYQDTNTLQAEILRLLKPDGRGVTVVGDDAQAIYSFRAARVGNILAFPQPVRSARGDRDARAELPLDGADPGRGQRGDRAAPPRAPREEPVPPRARAASARVLATVADELAQVDYVVERILERREAGVPLRQQAVLFRAAHHSDALEVELGRRNIPFVKFGGLRFLEAAHVKDALACLRWAENPRDSLAGFRVAQLLPGMGPRLADALVRHLAGRALRAAARAARASTRPPPRAPTGRRSPSCSRACATRPRPGRAQHGAGAPLVRAAPRRACTTTRACASAISSSWNSWPRRRRRASASCRS